jgi:hypothetical protein
MAAEEEFADRQKILTSTGSFNRCRDIDDYCQALRSPSLRLFSNGSIL